MGKTKGPYHSFRVSTDEVRAECCKGRAQHMSDRLAARAELARAMAADAVVHIPRAADHALCPPGALTGTREVVAFGQETVRRVDIEQRKQKANKPFMLKLLPSASLSLESPLLRLDAEALVVGRGGGEKRRGGVPANTASLTFDAPLHGESPQAFEAFVTYQNVELGRQP